MADFEQDQVVRRPDGQVQVLKQTLQADEKAVEGIRQEIPIGIAGQAIERLPVTEQSEMLLKMGTFVKLVGGRQTCLRIVELPLQGGKIGRFHCSRTCVSVGLNAGYRCPEHDKGAFPNERHCPPGPVINSASIELSTGEKMIMVERDGKKVAVALEPGRDLAASQPAPIAPVKTRVRRPRSDSGIPRKKELKEDGSVKIILTLAQLEANDWDSVVVKAIHDALDLLPARTISDMKRVVAIQEKLKGEGA